MKLETYAAPQRALGMALLCAALVGQLACTSGREVTMPDGFAQGAGLGHLAYIDAEADVVVATNRMATRARTLVDSRAWGQFKKFLQRHGQDDPEIVELIEKSDQLADTLEKHLKGRLTMAIYEPTYDEQGTMTSDEGIIIIADGDIRELFKIVRELDGADMSQGRFVELGQGLTQYVDDDPDTEDNYYFMQRGPVGLLGSERELVERIALRGGAGLALVEDAAFKGLTEGLNLDADVLLWVRDWSDESGDDWDTMLGGNGQAVSRGFAATATIEHGVDIEAVVDMSPQDIDDPELRELAPMLIGVQQPPAAPAVLPATTLAYMGINVSMDEILARFSQEVPPGAMPGGFDPTAFAASFQGEFGAAITSGPTDGGVPDPALGVPLPGMVMVARLKGDAAQKTIEDAMALFIPLLQQQDPVLGPAVSSTMGGHRVTLYPTTWPGLEVGYGFINDFMIMGNRQGLKDVFAGVDARDRGTTLAAGTGFEMIDQSFTQKSNYLMHIDLLGLYQELHKHQGMMLSAFTQGVLGGPDDPMMVLLSVFRFVGMNLNLQGDRLRMRLYLTAADLR